MDPKEHAEKLAESARAGLEKAMAEGKTMTIDSVAPNVMVAEAGKPQLLNAGFSELEMRLISQLSPEDQKVFLERRAKNKAMRKAHAAHKAPKRPGPNEPCPCGRTSVETGKPLKFKKCCGSVVGDLHFFVADVATDEPLMNDEGLVLVFKDIPTASAAARAKGWLDDLNRRVEVVSLNPDKYKHFQMAIPHVLVTAKEFEVGDKVETPETVAPPTMPSADMGVMVHHEPCPDCKPCEHIKP